MREQFEKIYELMRSETIGTMDTDCTLHKDSIIYLIRRTRIMCQSQLINDGYDDKIILVTDYSDPSYKKVSKNIIEVFRDDSGEIENKKYKRSNVNRVLELIDEVIRIADYLEVRYEESQLESMMDLILSVA